MVLCLLSTIIGIYKGSFKGSVGFIGVYSRSPIVGNPIASILKSNIQGIPSSLFGLNPVSSGFQLGSTVMGFFRKARLDPTWRFMGTSKWGFK